jgi:uncharacterized protein
MTSPLGSNRRSEHTATPDVVRREGLLAPLHSAEWPLSGLNIEQVREQGWRPRPLREFVLKIHGRCNLACDHCYMFTMADQGWRAKPAAMNRQTIIATAQRIREHVSRHGLSQIRVVFHGGEPLLAGRDVIVDAAEIIRGAVPPATGVELAIQSNGLLLTEDVLRSLREHRIRVGISLDGEAVDHDRHRRSASGRGSHARVAAALSRLGQDVYRDIFSGLLCTIDLESDPLRTYEELLRFGPPAVDFLLPHGNWGDPPPRREPASSSTPYADWLIPIFDRWYSAPQRPTDIRIFGELMHLILGGPSHTETVGLSPVGLLVVATDGSMEQVDALRSAYDGASATGLNVFSDSFDRALAHPTIVARQIGIEALGDTCRSCSVRDVCGGGFYPHRYRPGEGYRNPSVYCPDLFRLIQHIRGRLLRDTRALLRS